MEEATCGFKGLKFRRKLSTEQNFFSQKILNLQEDIYQRIMNLQKNYK